MHRRVATDFGDNLRANFAEDTIPDELIAAEIPLRDDGTVHCTLSRRLCAQILTLYSVRAVIFVWRVVYLQWMRHMTRHTVTSGFSGRTRCASTFSITRAGLRKVPAPYCCFHSQFPCSEACLLVQSPSGSLDMFEHGMMDIWNEHALTEAAVDSILKLYHKAIPSATGSKRRPCAATLRRKMQAVYNSVVRASWGLV